MIEDDLIHSWLLCLSDNAWCSLHFEDPRLDGPGRGEIFGGGYVRRKLDFSAPSNRAIWQLEAVRFVGLNANRLTHFGVWNHKEGGKLRASGKLPGGGTVVAQGGGYVLPAGKIAISLG